MKINKIAVIGSGVMGGGIAAHVANAGFPVTLLDIVPKKAENKNVVVETALENMLKPVKQGSPSPFMHKNNAKLITAGNLEDDLDLIKEADLIIEVVIEKLDIKHQIYRMLDNVRKKILS